MGSCYWSALLLLGVLAVQCALSQSTHCMQVRTGHAVVLG